MSETNGITKQDLAEVAAVLKSDMNEVATALKSDMNEVATALKSDMNGVATALKSDMNGVATALKSNMIEMETRLRLHVSEECEKVETRPLAEFWKWGRSADQKMRRVEYSDTTTVERLAVLEERVFTLERRAAGSKE